jgi:Leucine-rich repeat (LRR) protein
VTLRWTAPSGGGESAAASLYDLRYASTAIDAASWAAALQIEDEPTPGFAGLPQSFLLTGTPPDTVVYFAIRACGSTGVWSEISNSPSAVVPPETAVAFADSALESVIRAIVQMPAGDLMPTDLLAVTRIDAAHRGIRTREGIQYCASLNQLNLQGNAVTDLGPLAGLARLSDLDASGNQVSDIGPLADLVAMMNLNLSDNAIRGVAALQQMAMLNFLWLDRNQITDIAPVAGCWRLNHLFLSDNSIDDLSPLATMKYVADLDLTGNAIMDLAPLVTNSDFGTGDRIWLARNPLSTAAISEQIPALRARGVVVYER